MRTSNGICRQAAWSWVPSSGWNPRFLSCAHFAINLSRLLGTSGHYTKCLFPVDQVISSLLLFAPWGHLILTCHQASACWSLWSYEQAGLGVSTGPVLAPRLLLFCTLCCPLWLFSAVPLTVRPMVTRVLFHPDGDKHL